MLLKHKLLSIPDSCQKIWRYIDLTKYLDLLITGELHFSNPNQFDDPYDTSISAYFRDNNLPTFILKAFHDIFMRGKIHINCWHLNEEESAALWKIYMKSDEGIAIQSSIGRLIQVIEKADKGIYLGKVNYENVTDIVRKIESTQTIITSTQIEMITNKRKSFQHEQEVRIFVLESEELGLSTIERVKIDINELIENVYVNPRAPSWVYETIKSVSKKYGMKANVIHSKLYSIR